MQDSLSEQPAGQEGHRTTTHRGVVVTVSVLALLAVVGAWWIFMPHTRSFSTGTVMCLTFSPDGQMLALGTVGAGVVLWDVAGGKVVRTLEGGDPIYASAAFSPDGRTLATGLSGVTLWDVASGRKLQTLSLQSADILHIAFSTDGHTLLSSTRHLVGLSDVRSGTTLQTILQPDDEPVASVALSRDGRLLAVGTDTGNIKLWDVASGQLLKMLPGHTKRVSSLSFSPDGRTLASVSFDSSVKLWDLASGQTLRSVKLQGHAELLNSALFSPDGRKVAAWTLDQTIGLWGVEDGKSLLTLRDPKDQVIFLSFSPDGRTLASGSLDSLKLWELPR